MILDDFRLTGRVALVTGANRGLGQAIAIALAEAGADVALACRGDATETAAQIEALGRRTMTVHCDLATASVADLGEVVNAAVDGLGGLGILVNNAGIIRRNPALTFTETDWDDVLQVNLKAAFFMAQAAAAVMVPAGGGAIINIASLLSFQGGILVPSYTSAKAGIAGLTKALANEWASLGINVNAIAPGYMVTDNTEALRADAQRQSAISERIPAGRWGTPHDLAGAAVFLASPAASYVQGATLTVDGGWMAR